MPREQMLGRGVFQASAGLEEEYKLILFKIYMIELLLDSGSELEAELLNTLASARVLVDQRKGHELKLSQEIVMTKGKKLLTEKIDEYKKGS